MSDSLAEDTTTTTTTTTTNSGSSPSLTRRPSAPDGIPVRHHPHQQQPAHHSNTGHQHRYAHIIGHSNYPEYDDDDDDPDDRHRRAQQHSSQHQRLVSACQRLGINTTQSPHRPQPTQIPQMHRSASPITGLSVASIAPPITRHVSRSSDRGKQPRHQQHQSSSATRSSSRARRQQQQQQYHLQQPSASYQHHFMDDATAAVHRSGPNNAGVEPNKGTYGQESWGRDSGARDLSPAERRQLLGDLEGGGGRAGADEPVAGLPLRLHGDDVTRMAVGDTHATSMIHLANQLQVAALSALKTEVLELSARLQNSERERDVAQRKLIDAQEERERSQRRLESLGAAHESRITEMHCVIVELNRKLKSRQDNAIIEEHEPEGSVSELSFQDGSVYNSEMECTNNNPAQQHDEPAESPTGHAGQRRASCESPATLPPPISGSIQVQAMHEEILHLRSQMALLQSQIASQRDGPSDRRRLRVDADDDDDADEDADDERASGLDERGSRTPPGLCTSDDIGADVSLPPAIQTTGGSDAGAQYAAPLFRQTPQPRSASAQMHRASRTTRTQRNAQGHYHAASVTLPPTHANAQLPHHVRQRSAERPLGPIRHAVAAPTDADHSNSDDDGDAIGDNDDDDGDSLAVRQRLQRKLKHARFQNSILSLTVAESRAHANHLYLLCGKYESNAIALQQALCCSDRAIEAYDVMLALLESQVTMFEQAAHRNGGGSESASADAKKNAFESRRTAEAVAKHLLERLSRVGDASKPAQLNNASNWLGNSLGPWNETIVLTAEDNEKAPRWTDDEDRLLRAAISKLKAQRAIIQDTIVKLESPFSAFDGDSQGPPADVAVSEELRRHCDLETAVLAQEVVSLQMELAQSRQRVEHAVRDRTASYKRAAAMQDALVHLQAQLADTEQRLAACASVGDRSSYTDAEHAVGIERELVEALARESRLKQRLQSLAGSVEAATKSSEEKYLMVQNTVAELKQTNVSLTQSLDRCRHKYQTRLARMRRLEQKMSEMQLTAQQPIASSLQPQTETAVSNSSPEEAAAARNDQPLQRPSGNPVPETTL